MRPVRCLGPWFLSPFDLNKLQGASVAPDRGTNGALPLAALADQHSAGRSFGNQTQRRRSVDDRSIQVVAEFSEIIGGAVGKLTVGLGPHEFGRV